jgi:hypothetical protein
MGVDDSSIAMFVQVNPQSGPVVPQGASDDFVRATEAKLKQVAYLVKTSWKELVSDLGNMQNPPAEISVEFGVDVGAEGGIPFITKGSITANFKVSIVWKTAKA